MMLTPITRHALVMSLVVISVLWCSTSQAHHEAIFGPHSSTLFSSKGFIGFQTFNIASGTSGQSEHEQVGILAGGIPLGSETSFSIAVVQPLSLTPGLESQEFGVEDTIVGLRYHFTFEGLQERWGSEKNFLTLLGAAELPTGNVDDHEPFSGPLDTILAGLAGLENGRWSGIGYLYRRFNGYNKEGSKSGDLFYVGGGIGYSLWEDSHSEQSINLQLGLSFEHTGESVLNGVALVESDGWLLSTQPTIVYTPSHHWLLFTSLALPIVQDFQDTANEQLWRVGIGVVWFFGEDEHNHESHDHGAHHHGSHPH